MPVTYFAYGSNMSAKEMARVCPNSKLLGPAILPGFRLAFTRRSIIRKAGVADVVEDPLSSVWGALYLVDEMDIPALDIKEGYPRAYTRVECTVLQIPGREPRKAFTYTVEERQSPNVRSTPGYWRMLEEGLERLGDLIEDEGDRQEWRTYRDSMLDLKLRNLS
jgi:gamma-glutamylcyclotransferase